MTAAFLTARRLLGFRVKPNFCLAGMSYSHAREILSPSSYRRSTLKILPLAIVAVFFGCLHLFAGEKPSSTGAILEGTFWKITVVPDDASAKSGTEKFNDTISFAEGKFSSAALAQKGFKPAKYQGDFEEREAEFDLEQKSESEGIVIWIGEVRGAKITGRLQWKKKDGTNLFFNFTGAKAAN
jgi:hypothetical protein